MKLERLKELAGMEQLSESADSKAVSKSKAKLKAAIDEMYDTLVREVGDEVETSEKLGSILRMFIKEYT